MAETENTITSAVELVAKLRSECPHREGMCTGCAHCAAAIAIELLAAECVAWRNPERDRVFKRTGGINAMRAYQVAEDDLDDAIAATDKAIALCTRKE